MEHLEMFNQEQFGLHHPGNIVPVCPVQSACRTRFKGPDKLYVAWEEQLGRICKEKEQPDKISERKGRILVHMKSEGYPNLSREEKRAVQLIAESLYKNIQNESEKSLELYQQLHEAFVKS